MGLKQLAIKFNSLKMSTGITHFFQLRYFRMALCQRLKGIGIDCPERLIFSGLRIIVK
jgi:hypothetical protein